MVAKVTSVHGDEFMAFKSSNVGDARLVHLTSRVETLISAEHWAYIAGLTIDFVDDVEGLKEAMDDCAASIMIARGLLAWDEWTLEYRSPEDIAAEQKDYRDDLRDRVRDHALHMRACL